MNTDLVGSLISRRSFVGLSLFGPASSDFSGAWPNPSGDGVLRPRLAATKASERPRLMLRGTEANSFRSFLYGSGVQVRGAGALAFLAQHQLPPEPPALLHTPAGRGQDVLKAAQQAWRMAGQTATAMQLSAFKHLAFKQDSDLHAAARWARVIAAWPLRTEEDYRRNDEAFVQSLQAQAFAYDWLHDSLSASDRDELRRELATRTDALYRALQRAIPWSRPLVPGERLSHPVRFVATLGHAALALWGEHDPASEQLAWVVNFYERIFPVWGGDDGGWSEGIQYLSSALSHHLRVLEDLQAVGLTQVTDRPFWRNTGYFLAHFLMPFETASFGDLPQPARPTPARRLLMEKLAHLNGDGLLMALADRFGQVLPERQNYYQFGLVDTLAHLWRMNRAAALNVRSLDELPRSRHFRDVGWVAMHSRWDVHADTVMMGFKSSPIGAVSHGFADQNSFVINAYGQAMAVSSGVRDLYGSPHYERWTRASRSKNSVLLDGHGPEGRDPQGTGRILRFVGMKNIDFVTGDASAAYRHLAKSVLRHVVFVDRRYFVVLDEITARRMSKHQWRIHTRVRPQLDLQGVRVVARYEGCGLTVQLFAPGNSLTVTEAAGYDPPPDMPVDQIPAAWHTTFETASRVVDQRFVALLQPWKGQEPDSGARLAAASAGHVLQVGDDLVYLSREEDRLAQFAGGRLVGRAATVTSRGIAGVEMRELQHGGLVWTSTSDVSAELTFQGLRHWELRLQPHPALTMELSRDGVAPSLLQAPPGIDRSVIVDRLRISLPASDHALSMRLAWN